MKIVDGSPSPLLTNSEVLAVLKDREDRASRGVSGILQSETEVLKSLELRGTVVHTRAELEAFKSAITAELSISKEEVLQLINHTPTDILGAYLCLEQALNQGRISEDDLDRVLAIVAEHLKKE